MSSFPNSVEPSLGLDVRTGKAPIIFNSRERCCLQEVTDWCLTFVLFSELLFFLSRNKMVATVGGLFRLRRMGVSLAADSGPPPGTGVGRAGSWVEAAARILSFDAGWCSSSFGTGPRMSFYVHLIIIHFGCTCRGELLEPHQFPREAPLKLFCRKCFSFPPFTSLHSSPYPRSHQCQSSSVFHSCPL